MERHIDFLIDLLYEYNEKLKKLNNSDEHLNNNGCENCNGYFGYSAEEGYLYECCDCQQYYSSRKKDILELENKINLLKNIIDYLIEN